MDSLHPVHKPTLGLHWAQAVPFTLSSLQDLNGLPVGAGFSPLILPAGSLPSGFKERALEGGASSPHLSLPTLHPEREVKAQVPRTHDL